MPPSTAGSSVPSISSGYVFFRIIFPFNIFSKAGANLESEDRNKNTPLHLAAKHGHEGVVQVSFHFSFVGFIHYVRHAQALVECGADLTAINLTDHNPLLEAIARGNREVILAILGSDRWKEAVRSVKMTSSGVKETPVKQLIKRFPDLAKESVLFFRRFLLYGNNSFLQIVFDKSISTNLHSNGKIKNQNEKTVSPDSPELQV